MTRFAKGDVVESTVTAQGLTAGTRYIVVAVNEMATPFGTFVTNLLVRSLADEAIPVANGHLILKPALPTAAGEVPAEVHTQIAGASPDARIAAAEPAPRARKAKTEKAPRAPRGSHKGETHDEEKARWRLYSSKARAKKALAAGAPVEQAIDLLIHGGWSREDARTVAKALMGDGAAKPAARRSLRHAAPEPHVAAPVAAQPAPAPAAAPQPPVTPSVHLPVGTVLAGGAGLPTETKPAEPGTVPTAGPKRKRAKASDLLAPNSGPAAAPSPAPEPTVEAAPPAPAPAKEEPKREPVTEVTDEALGEKVRDMLAANPKLGVGDVIAATHVSFNRANAALKTVRATVKAVLDAAETKGEPAPAAPTATQQERLDRAAAAKARLAQLMGAGKPPAQA